MAVWFEVVSGPAAQGRVEVDGELLIGREGPPEGRLGGDAGLSRRHARLSPFGDGEQLLVEDLDSTNGTFVNGERIGAPTVVSAQDTVELGDSALRVIPAPRETGDLARHGVHEVPEHLFATLIARTPVPREWIIQGALRAWPIVLAVNLLIRTIAVEGFDVDPDGGPMKLEVLFGVSTLPIVASSFFFWVDFGRRPRDRTILIYVIPSLFFSSLASAIELISLPSSAGFKEYAATVLVALVSPCVVMPTMIALRARARLKMEASLKDPART